MPKTYITTNLVFIFALFFSKLAFAHVGDVGGGFWLGFNHPVLGLDHLLAMVSVGIISTQMGGKAIWSVPVTFIVVMLVGGVLGMVGVPLFSIELGIAISVLALGVIIAVDKTFPTGVMMLFVAVFAVFHGHAHGTEMPNLANPIQYALGFMMGTAIIHIVGVAIGITTKKHQYGEKLMRIAGTGIAAAGVYFILI